MSQSPTTPDEFAADHLDEELVAYLDGELDAESTRRLEERLEHDQQLRERLAQLQATWDLLDSLPSVQVDAGFTQTTVSMVALRTRKESRARRRQWAWALAGLAGLLMAAAAGYFTVNYQISAPERQLAKDLPVIERIDLYLVADSVDFLRQLAEERLFDEEATHAP
jgi:anti-sigma factor RsiW